MTTPRARLLPLVLAFLLPAACGSDEPGPPAVVETAGTRPTPEALLARLADRIARGEGISDESWTRDVQEVGMALWPLDDSPLHLAARADHTNLAHIAGDMAVQLSSDPDARDGWLERDAGSVAIHDAFVENAGRGVEGYVEWVVGPGHALLEERIRGLSTPPPR